MRNVFIVLAIYVVFYVLYFAEGRRDGVATVFASGPD